MDSAILEKAQKWAENTYFDAEFRNEIRTLIETKAEAELVDRFYKELEFGTGGLRGVLGAGSNRMNIYTVRKATQGVANYILEKNSGVSQSLSASIAFDSRHFSELFSRETASVFAANGIKVNLYKELRPVPMLSFAVRELESNVGIMITASHNPAEYNGFKVYWSDGCQITPPHDHGIIEKANAIQNFNQINWMQFQIALDQGLIEFIPQSVEEAYFKQVESLSVGDKKDNKLFGVVYTPLHGTGNYPVREILHRRGFENVRVVAAQETPDGRFPTVSSPNPEEPSALQLAVEEARDEDYLIIGTDPDADRLGVMVKHENQWHKINGNQIGQLMLDYYLAKLKDQNRLPKSGVFISTIVSSELGRRIADKFGVKTIETLTGFKYIGSVIADLEQKQSGDFIFGTEESHGYLFGGFVRDKDGVSASMIFSEMCAELHQQGKTPLQQLEQIHHQHGFHIDSLINKVIKGQAGAQQISKIMDHLRNNPPKKIATVAINQIRDYLNKQIVDCLTGKVVGQTEQPESNVLAFYLADDSRITARPSGTEPKIKFYFNLRGEDAKSLDNIKHQYETEFINIIDTI